MKLIQHSAAIFLASVVATVPSTAQPQGMATWVPPTEAQGKFSNVPVGMVMNGATQANQWLIRSPGVSGGIPIAWSSVAFGTATQTHPDYSFGALTNHWATGSVPPPAFGGVSTGGEVMPAVTSDGKMTMTIGNWYMLSITVGRNARGMAGGLIESRRIDPITLAPRNPAGDIFSYYAAGSTGINTALVDKVFLEYSREQLQLQAPAPTTNEMREVANHDFGLGVISTDPEGRAGSIFPVRNAFYFTVTQTWVTAVGPTFMLGGSYVKSSTIYGMTWDGSTWTQPFAAFEHSLLFPNRSVGSVEIDALSIDRGSGTAQQPDRTVFSLTPGSDQPGTGGTFDQILVYQRANSVNPLCNTTALVATNSATSFTPVSVKFGLQPRASFEPLGEPDNVRSTCGGDPKEPYQVGPVVGIATAQEPCGESKLGLSAVRTCVPFDYTQDTNTVPPASGLVDTLHLQVTGLEFAPYTWGFVIIDLYGMDGEPIQWGSAYWIDPISSARNALDIHVALPNQLINLPLRLSARCVGVNSATPQLHTNLRESWVINIVL